MLLYNCGDIISICDMQYDMMVTNKAGGINSLKIIYAVKFINWQIYSYKLHFTVRMENLNNKS